MRSPKVAARLAGSLYLFASVCFAFAMFVRPSIEASATAGAADKIRHSAFLFRVGLASELVAWACFLLTAMTLYVLLRHVHRLAAAAMVVLVAVLVAVGYLNDVNLYTALTVATDAHYQHAFGTDASNELVTLSTDTQVNGLIIDELFWGLWLVPLSYLVMKSGQFPRPLGVLLIVAVVNWTGQFFANLLAPDLPYVTSLGQIGGVGELIFAAWLLIFGIRLTAAQTPASAMAATARRE
jgi:hypothetical protein